MEQIKIEILLQAETPIAHSQETLGNTQMCMRRKVQQPDGSFASVPYITGDTLRHGLREAGTYALLDAAGLTDAGLSEPALRLLFAGGMVTGSPGAVKLDDYRDLVDLCPHIALLGGCAQNRVTAGKLNVGFANLVCSEAVHVIPPWVFEWTDSQNRAISSCRRHIELMTRVRMDPALDPGKRTLLSAGEREKVELRLLRSENASAHDDAKEKDAAKSTMMPFSYETVVAGSLFHWRLSCICHSELDRDMLFVMLASFLANCVVGGKKGTGNGVLRPVAAREIAVPRWSERVNDLDVTALGGRVGSIFRAHVAERADRLRAWLSGVAA